MDPAPRRDPAAALIEAAATILDDEGRDAVTARRLGREIGASAMAVYTYFGSMEELLAAVWRRGFTELGRSLADVRWTADPVADWIVQGWHYRDFALRNRHLYRVMFSDGLVAFNQGDPQDREVALGTFAALLELVQRCIDSGRWSAEDVFLGGEVVWVTTHGHCELELTGYFPSVGRDPERLFAQCTRSLALGFGDDPELVERSLDAARRRTRRLRAAAPPPAGVSASRPSS